ncbi:MAG: hypothetical protein PWP76_15 [Candidatus Diapherotrites archaeon]|nr:hypothetical protein [Candidatus Diapherotrites archaeon]
MATITTIPIRKETRKILEPLKGNRTWDEFLLELAELKRKELKKDLKLLRELVDTDKIERAETWAR